MNPRQLLAYFGSKRSAARALGITVPAIDQWEAAGAIPELRQYQIELATAGGLRADLPADRTIGLRPAPAGAGK
jgi:DNA-binding transcriptional regulator YdaS (Cro superfamily)